jgi:antitoxin component of MazEF toxin-antitoxin module
VRLPKSLVEKMGLRAGDQLNIVDVVERTLVVQKQDRRKAALVAQLDPSSRLQIRSGRGQRAVKAFFDTDIRECANSATSRGPIIGAGPTGPGSASWARVDAVW